MAEQGTLDWYAERWGKITMSRTINTIMDGHVHELNNLLKLIRWQRDNADMDTIRQEYEREQRLSDHVENLRWGKSHEAEAVAQYELTRNVSVIRPGFKSHPLYPDLVGGSIDFIETDDGTIDGKPKYVAEIKCPIKPENHLKTLRYGMGPWHVHQTQGNIEIMQLSDGMFVSYDPRHAIESQRLYVQALERDPLWSKRFHERMEEFALHIERGTQFDFAMGKATDGIPSMF